MDTSLHCVKKPRPTPRAVQLITDVENERYLSAVSSWEICIKYSKGRLRLPEIPEHFIPKHRHQLAAEELPLDEESVLHATRLPQLHADPFDRVLICQAIIHGMVLLTPDAFISKYPVRTAW